MKFIKHNGKPPKHGPDHGARRHVGVDVDLAALGSMRVIDADLFDGDTVTLDLDHIEHRGNGYTWHGKDGSALLSVVGNAISGTIHANGKKYQVQTQADGSTLLREIDDSLFPPDHPPP